MKKLFFYSNIMAKDNSIGITKKVKSQKEAFNKQKIEVHYCGYLPNGVGVFNDSNQLIAFKEYPSKSSKINGLIRRWYLIKFVTNFLNEHYNSYDIGYLRFHLFDHYYVKMLKTLKKNKDLSVVVEAHGFPYRHKIISSKTPLYVIDYLYTPIARKYIDIVAGVTETKSIWGIETVNIDNGIDLDKVNIIKNEHFNDNVLNIISVANETQLHGYRKILKGLREYINDGGEKRIHLHLVGVYMSDTIKLVDDLKLNSYVTFHGKLYGEDLDEVYEVADLGLGAFSDRDDKASGSCIKTKEYFAKGLPFINGWREPAFDESYPYVKRIGMNLDSINFLEVVNFFENLPPKKIVRDEMREFANENYSWDSQIKLILNKINKND